MKMYGLFRCSVLTEKSWVLIMGSVFPKDIKIHEIFDLKGRKPKPGKSHGERGVKSTHVLKDNEINRQLYFENLEDKEFFMNQLDTDVDLLKNHDVMDYSLLIGVHKPDKIEDEDPEPETKPKDEKRKSNLKRSETEKTKNTKDKKKKNDDDIRDSKNKKKEPEDEDDKKKKIQMMKIIKKIPKKLLELHL